VIHIHEQVQGLGVCVNVIFQFKVAVPDQFTEIALIRYSTNPATWSADRVGIAGLRDEQWYGLGFSYASRRLIRLMNIIDEQMMDDAGVIRARWTSLTHGDIQNYKRLLDMYREASGC
jgi:hypothetical protein